MRILHTSDWHLGRSFGQFPLADDQRAFTEWLVEQCTELHADLVIIAGDVYDRAVAPTDAIDHFRSTLQALLATGVKVAVITGNHDGADRVAPYDDLLDLSGLYLRGGYVGVGDVVTIEFADGPLDLVLLPYLDPQAAPDAFGRTDEAAADASGNSVHARGNSGDAGGNSAEASYARRMRRTHESVLRDAVADVLPRLRAARSVAVAHAFVAGGESSESERDLLIGGTAVVSAEVFAPFSYTALGHLHRPQQIGTPTIRYSGTPLAYSFSETHAKSITVVDLAPDGTAEVYEVPVPVGRAVRTITGPITDLLAIPEAPGERDSFVRVILTDPGVVLDAKARLAQRWPYVAEIELRPTAGGDLDGVGRSTAGRRTLRADEMLVEFWKAATSSDPTDAERALLFEHLEAARLEVGA